MLEDIFAGLFECLFEVVFELVGECCDLFADAWERRREQRQ